MSRWPRAETRSKQHERFAQAVNAVLAEALRDGYGIAFSEGTEVQLITPNGLRLWFCAAHESDGVVALVLDMDPGALLAE